jgi:hypothetical protein
VTLVAQEPEVLAAATVATGTGGVAAERERHAVIDGAAARRNVATAPLAAMPSSSSHALTHHARGPPFEQAELDAVRAATAPRRRRVRTAAASAHGVTRAAGLGADCRQATAHVVDPSPLITPTRSAAATSAASAASASAA